VQWSLFGCDHGLIRTVERVQIRYALTASCRQVLMWAGSRARDGSGGINFRS